VVPLVAIVTLGWKLVPRKVLCVSFLAAAVATSVVRMRALVSFLNEKGYAAGSARAMRRGCASLVSVTSSWPLETSVTSENVARACASVGADADLASVAFVGLLTYCVMATVLHVRRVRVAFVSYLMAVVMVDAMYARGDGLDLVAHILPSPFDAHYLLSESVVASIDELCVHTLRLACGWAAYALLT